MKIFVCIFYISKLFASISGLFHVRIVLSLSSTLHSLENHVIAHCFPNFSAYLAKFLLLVSQIRTIHEYSENITSQKFPAPRYYYCFEIHSLISLSFYLLLHLLAKLSYFEIFVVPPRFFVFCLLSLFFSGCHLQ